MSPVKKPPAVRWFHLLKRGHTVPFFFFLVWEPPATSHRGLRTLGCFLTQFPPFSLNRLRAKPCLAQPPAPPLASALLHGKASTQYPGQPHTASFFHTSYGKAVRGQLPGRAPVRFCFLFCDIFFSSPIFESSRNRGREERCKLFEVPQKKISDAFYLTHRTSSLNGLNSQPSSLPLSEPPQICYLKLR